MFFAKIIALIGLCGLGICGLVLMGNLLWLEIQDIREGRSNWWQFGLFLSLILIAISLIIAIFCTVMGRVNL